MRVYEGMEAGGYNRSCCMDFRWREGRAEDGRFMMFTGSELKITFVRLLI